MVNETGILLTNAALFHVNRFLYTIHFIIHLKKNKSDDQVLYDTLVMSLLGFDRLDDCNELMSCMR